jgi:signal transduction histidine kinase
LAIDAGNLARREAFPEGMRQSLDAMREKTIRLAEDVQGLSRRLHPSILDDLGLVAALRAETKALQDRLNIAVSFAAEDPPPDFPKSSSLALYRICQEAFHNIARHARASEVNVELVVAAGTVRLRIEDDGVGFDATQLRPGGLGIASLAERARLAGGQLIIRAAPCKGVKIIAELPASAPEEEALLT